LGIGIETLRYYEKKGLIKAPEREINGYRTYTTEDANNIRHILLLKASGFTIKEIQSLSKLGNPAPEVIKEIIRSKISDLNNKIEKLNVLKNNLKKVLDSL
jgi:MerR family mercuric resistance operon transcriptional regulator